MFQISRFKISNKVRNAMEFSPPQDGRIDDGVDDIDTIVVFLPGKGAFISCAYSTVEISRPLERYRSKINVTIQK